MYLLTLISGFKNNTKEEFQLIRKINFQPDKFLTEIPKPRTVKINILDALKRALSHNQEIQNDITSYKESLLSYQSTMFQFQFSAGSLSYDASYGYQDQGPSLSSAIVSVKHFQLDLNTVSAAQQVTHLTLL